MTAVAPRTIDSPAPGSPDDDRERMAVSLAIRENQVFDVAELSEEDFTRGLATIRRRQERMQQILDTVLVEGVHYGNPKVRGGGKAFEKPMLLLPGAEELAKFFRLTCRHTTDPIIQASSDYTSVIVSLGCYDVGGKLVAVRSGSCNSLEKRFKKRSGNGWTFVDAREVVHQCLAMAEKRAQTLVIRAATGATAFFCAEEEMDKALAEDTEGEEVKPLTLEQALNFAVKGKPLSAFRNTALTQLGEWAQGKLEKDPEDQKLARLLEAVHLVEAARTRGELDEPPKESPTPIKTDGYEEPREPGEDDA